MKARVGVGVGAGQELRHSRTQDSTEVGARADSGAGFEPMVGAGTGAGVEAAAGAGTCAAQESDGDRSLCRS